MQELPKLLIIFSLYSSNFLLYFRARESQNSKTFIKQNYPYFASREIQTKGGSYFQKFQEEQVE